MPEAAAALSERTWADDYVRADSDSEVRKNSEDFALMLEWFERVGYDVDIAALARESGSVRRRSSSGRRRRSLESRVQRSPESRAESPRVDES